MSSSNDAAPTAPPVRAPGAHGRGLFETLRSSAWAVPTLHKILLANGVLLLLTVATCALFAQSYLRSGSAVHPAVAFGGIALLALAALAPVHYVILRLALAPLTILESTAERIEAGDASARAPISPFADPGVARLTMVLNRVLDGVQLERRKLRTVAAHAFRAQEAERTRLARELQEDAAQRVANLLLRLRLARTAGAIADETAYEHLRKELLDVLHFLRAYATGLFPPALRELGIAAALTNLARTASESSPVRVTAEVEEIPGLLEPERELALFRIVQEAVGNALRHSGAGSVTIHLRAGGESVQACVADDGNGFSPSQVLEELPCLGLVGMKERALYADGTLDIDSAPAAGTRVCIRLSVNPSPVPPAVEPPALAAV